MPNLYEKNTDIKDTPVKSTLFRKRYRELTSEEIQLHDEIKDKADELAELIRSISPTSLPTFPDENRERGANVQLAIRHLEDCIYRAVKGLTT
jgi:hypothetical protein